MNGKNRAVGAVARVFMERPDRLAGAWRRVRFAEAKKGQVPDNLLDDVVEGFVREVGLSLLGHPGSAWSRTKGVLRLSHQRGPHALYAEFASLRRCLVDAVEVLGGSEEDTVTVNACLDEAVDSALATFRRLIDPRAAVPEVLFGGLVVEYYERPEPKRAVRRPEPEAALH